MAMILINKKEIEENGELFIIETYQSNKTGKESAVKYPKPFNTPVESETPQPTQLDLIQQAVEKSNNELRQEGADALMLELINKNII